jgi:hypothetical protein
MEPAVQVALIAALSSLAGVLVGIVPSYFATRAQGRAAIRSQRLEWKRQYREKLLSKVEKLLEDRAKGLQVSHSLHLIGVFDLELAEIMSGIAESALPPGELIVAAYARMEELVGEGEEH